MPLAARILFGAFGLVVALYAAASLSGNWLSTPPWWERELSGDERIQVAYTSIADERLYRDAHPSAACVSNDDYPDVDDALATARVRHGRELISIGVGAVGLAALAFAARPRRRPGSAWA